MRLAQEEFEDRAGRALQARTGRELSELFTDLPQGQARVGMPPAAVDPGAVRRAGRAPTACVVIACVIAVIIVGNVLGNVFGHAQGEPLRLWACILRFSRISLVSLPALCPAGARN